MGERGELHPDAQPAAPQAHTPKTYIEDVLARLDTDGLRIKRAQLDALETT